jgi:hypothetical protein
MTIYRKSVKVIMSKEDILKIKPKRGIDVLFEPIHTNSNIYVCTISGTDLNPSNPAEELEGPHDINNFINDQLYVYSDRIREPKELAKIPVTVRQIAMNLNDPRLNNDNKYNRLRSKAKNITLNQNPRYKSANAFSSEEPEISEFGTVAEG